MSRGVAKIDSKIKFLINLLAQISVIVSQVIIGLFLTPTVLEKLGAEAYGFVGLVNNFVSYAGIVTTALNSLAGRYITIAHHKGQTDEAESYFSSVFYSNCFLAIIVLVLSIVLATNITSVVSVSTELVSDLQVMIVLAFLYGSIGLFSVVFGVAAFIRNSLYLNSLTQLLSSFIRVVLLCALFYILAPHVWYYSLSAAIGSFVALVAQVLISNRIAPEYRARWSAFSLKHVFNIIKNGVWTSLESVNKILQTGLDLLLSNLFVSAYAMGLFSVAKTLPNALMSMSTNFANLFYPKCAELYAREEKEKLGSYFSLAMRFTSGVMIVPLSGLIIFGTDFYKLWIPERSMEEVTLIQVLSILSLASLVSSALVEPLYYANTLANKLKGSVIITLIFSVITVMSEFLLLAFSHLNKLIIIASVSSIVMSIRHCVVQPFYAAKILNLRISYFYKYVARELFGLAVVLVSFEALSMILDFSTWINFAASCVVAAGVGYCELLFILLGRTDRGRLFHLLKDKVVHKFTHK